MSRMAFYPPFSTFSLLGKEKKNCSVRCIIMEKMKNQVQVSLYTNCAKNCNTKRDKEEKVAETKRNLRSHEL